MLGFEPQSYKKVAKQQQFDVIFHQTLHFCH